MLNQKIRKAEFVPTVEENKCFKSEDNHSLNRRYATWIANQKRRIKTITQKPKLWAAYLDWQKTKEDLVTWLIEAAVEGVSANFATHFLLGFPFDPMTVMAHGLAIKHAIHIYWRLRYNATPKLFKKDK